MALTNKPDNRILDRLSGMALSTLALTACCSTTFAGRAGPAAASPQEPRPSVAASGNPRGAGLESLAWRADLSGNGVVDFADIQLFLAAWDNSSEDPGQADINMDGVVNFADLNLILAFWGMAVQPPQSDGTLQPGDGFGGPTAQPAAVGVAGSPGYDAKAIARWDVVPYQDFHGEFEIGVVAFHMNGIDRVEFSAEGGPWVPVTEMTENPRTGVWEYWVTLDAEDFQDGLVEVRAIVYPETGVPRVLGGMIDGGTDFKNGNHSMFLNANAGGTLPSPTVWVDPIFGSDSGGVVGNAQSPFKTPFKALSAVKDVWGSADGAVCYLKPGNYVWGRVEYATSPVTNNRWATILPAPGVDRSEVVFSQDTSGGFRTDLLRVRNVTVSSRASASGSGRYLWLDNCALRDVASPWGTTWYAGVYSTDCTAQNVGHVFVGNALIRNCVIDGVNNDSAPGAAFVINLEVRNADATGTTNHSDIWQSREEHRENIILYGVLAEQNCREQGFFTRGGTPMCDVAIVNCKLQLVGYPAQSQFIPNGLSHFVAMHNSFLGSPVYIGVSDSANPYGWHTVQNAKWMKNVFQWMTLGDPQSVMGGSPTAADLAATTTFNGNHFINAWPSWSNNAGQSIGQPHGANATVGTVIPPAVGYYGDASPPWQD